MSLLSYGSAFSPEQLLLTRMHFDKHTVSVATVSSAIAFERSQCIVQSDLELEFLLLSFKCWDLCVPHSDSGFFKRSCYTNIIECTYTK